MKMIVDDQEVEIEKVMNTRVKSFGNGAMVTVPKKFIGKEAIVCIVSDDKFGDYEIRRDGFVQLISVDWDYETVRYYHNTSGEWLEDINGVMGGWCYQDKVTQYAYERFIKDISCDDNLLVLISELELNDSVISLCGYEIKRIA